MTGRERPFLIDKPTGAFAPVGIDRARRLAWFDVQRTHANQALLPSADPLHSHWIHKLHLDAGPKYLRGRVVDSVAYTNCHKVQFGMVGAMWCQMLTQTALQPMGARQLGQLPVGCEVLVMWFKREQTGIIIGVIPDIQTDSKTAMADFISQQARCGLLVDDAHNYPLTLANNSHIVDWSGGRPLDATTEGEAGNITETGLLDFIDSFMAVKRVDEECGIWHFWADQMTRIAGHNFQEWTAGYEREDLDDEGEFNKVEGHTPFYWEALSAFEFGLTVSKDIPASCWQKEPALQGLSAIEPCDEHQLAFYRLRDFYGYLGQAHKRVLCLPPVECSSSVTPMIFGETSSSSVSCDIPTCTPVKLNLINQQLIYPGVFEEDLGLTGRYAIRSAHEIIFSKHVLIPGHKQMKRPEDPTGDSALNYKAAGLSEFGTGTTHQVKGEIGVVGGDDPTQVRAAGFLDTHAFVFNWIGNHPFYYHQNDWWLPEEADLNYLSPNCHEIAFTPPRFDELACHQFLEAPAAIPIKVDHRYNEVKYYPNHSYFGMMPDGGIVMGCGFGSELKLVNGKIYLTAPGDIELHAGRNVMSFAGYDIILRAKNSWDVSATIGSGRLQANKNLWIAATGDCGGVLIQSKAKGTMSDFVGKTGDNTSLGGIVLKADHSLISVCGNDLSFSLNHADTKEHTIVFDAGWKGRLKFKSKFMERFLQKDGAALDFWVNASDDCSGDVVRGTEYWRDGTIMSSPLVVDDKILSTDCIAASGDLVSVTGHVITKLAGKTAGRVGQLKGPQDIEMAMTQFIHRNRVELPTIGDDELTTLCERQATFNICDAEFSFRSVEEYRTDDYVLFESRWQQLARVGGVSTAIWQEVEVNDTYPYPGKENLLGATYRTLDPKLYDITTGLAATRGPDYEDPTFNTPNAVILNNSYRVII